jgi:uncharacterized protein (DUF3084 family)
MLECAIPECGAQERLLRTGTLHLLDVVRGDGTIANKMVWLCASCTKLFTVQTWRAPGEQIRRRKQRPTSIKEILATGTPAMGPKPARSSPGRHAAA